MAPPLSHLGKATAATAASAASRARAGVTVAVRASEDALRRRRVGQLSEAERAEVRAVFDRADTLNRGLVDQIEVRQALHELSGAWMSDGELADYWATELSPHGAEAIGFEPFLLAVGPTMFPPKSVRVVQAAAARARLAAKPLAEHAGERATAAAQRLSDALVSRVLDAARGAAAADALDPDMPTPLRRALAHALRLFFADVEIEAKRALLGLLAHRRAPPLEPPAPRGCVPRALHGLRSLLLYNLLPYDRSVWRQLRSPLFWLLKGLSLFPLYGVQPAFFLLLFALIDRSDEHQLVAFILQFKGSQFASVGALSTLLGAGWYFWAGCGTPLPLQLWSAALLLGQVLTVLLALALLPRSHDKGRAPDGPDTQRKAGAAPTEGLPAAEEAGARPNGCCGRSQERRGGRLLPLGAYEALCALGCASLVAASYLGGDPPDRSAEVLFWARALYGLLALPFALFVLPVLGSLLTHARPTGYDPHGRCVPVLPPAEMRARRAERLADAAAEAEKRRDGAELRRRGEGGTTAAVVAVERLPAP